MFDLKDGWNISFAGCGFLGIYHIGVASCLLEQAPYLVKGASKIYGASAGALTASMLASGASIAKCCEDVVEMAKEARRRNLGPLHPSFNLLKVLRAGLSRDLPADAHVQASGRLCVSLTRVSDGQNELVTHFDSKEELIQALVCSCFIPIYCGLIPPSFRGVRYVDGGISNNLPQFEARNTITVSPFAGESDVCPRDGCFSLHELRFTNNSIHVTMGNVSRLSRALFPPEPKVMAEMCQNGYGDALRFLRENNLVGLERPTAGLPVPELKQTTPTCCCSGDRNGQPVPEKPVATETTKEWVLRKFRLLRKRHWWLDERIIHTLPTPLKKVLCEACREKHSLYAQVTDLLPVRVASYMLLPYTLPVQSAYSMAQRLVEWIPEVSEDVKWLYGMAGSAYRQAWGGGGPPGAASDVPVRKCLSMPPTLDLRGPLAEWDRCKLLSCMDPSSAPGLPPGPAPYVNLRTPGPAPGKIRFLVGEADELDPPSRPPDQPDACYR
ncbi:patatin-like phospholipase domain-containing protein 2 isoform X1 [Anguilla anguilla]|uniref:patatin-like phospholipase domain-containing protein 2 isoform X1 n=1 Tax=Anguilla anguilla TaxID=7936 RepID=UPI0015A9F98B|nr:patatin-like phospholipase domain-containing protein 2 isoform X1 [Anguilla anguilla]